MEQSGVLESTVKKRLRQTEGAPAWAGRRLRREGKIKRSQRTAGPPGRESGAREASGPSAVVIAGHGGSSLFLK